MTSNKEGKNAGGGGGGEGEKVFIAKLVIFHWQSLPAVLPGITVELKTQNRVSLNPLVCKYSPGAIAPTWYVFSMQWVTGLI